MLTYFDLNLQLIRLEKEQNILVQLRKYFIAALLRFITDIYF